MNKTLLLLALLSLPVSQVFATDATTIDYLQKLNRYYYCYPREGLENFQAHALSSFSGQMPPGFKKPWMDFDWQKSQCQFDFAYLGHDVMPIFSFLSGGGDPKATPERLGNMTDTANSLLAIWGEFMTQPIYKPELLGPEFTIVRGPDSAFSVVSKMKGRTTTIEYDKQALAHRMVIETPKSTKIVKLGFIHVPQGAILNQIELESKKDAKVHVILDLLVQYEVVQGFQVPSSFTFYIRTPGQMLQAVYKISDYQLLTKNSGGVLSDGGDTKIVSAGSEMAGTKHFFWRARSSTATVYLLGSIHVRKNIPLLVPQVVEQCFAASNYIGFEYDLSKQEETDQEKGPYIQAHCLYPAGDNIMNHLDARQRSIMQKIMKEIGPDGGPLLQMKPYILAEIFSDLGSQGLRHDKGIDEIFLRKAQVANKPVFGMEFWWEPLKQLDTLSDQEQAHMLFGSTKVASNKRRMLDEILADWKTGNTTDMEYLTNSGVTPEDKAIMDKILRARNEKWVGQFERIFKGAGTYFVVVGSAHMVGPSGLPSLLRQKGYSVEQL